MSQALKSQVKIGTVNELGSTIHAKRLAATNDAILAKGGQAAADKIVGLCSNAQIVINAQLEEGAYDEIAKQKDPRVIASMIQTEISKIMETIQNFSSKLATEQVTKNAMAKAFGTVEDSAKKMILTEQAKLQKLLNDAIELEEAQKLAAERADEDPELAEAEAEDDANEEAWEEPEAPQAETSTEEE